MDKRTLITAVASVIVLGFAFSRRHNQRNRSDRSQKRIANCLRNIIKPADKYVVYVYD